MALSPQTNSTTSMSQLDTSPAAECGYSPEVWLRRVADRPGMPPSADTDQRAGSEDPTEQYGIDTIDGLAAIVWKGMR